MQKVTVRIGCLEALYGQSNLLKQRALTNRKTIQQYYVTGAAAVKRSGKTLPLLTAIPSRALFDEPIAIQGRHLPPRWPVTLRASMRSDDGEVWEAHAHYRTDDSGTVDLVRDEAEGGSYTGCAPMGLFWSQEPVCKDVKVIGLMKKNIEMPYTVELSILSGHISQSSKETSGQVDGDQLATVTVERSYKAPGVHKVDVREGGLVATLFLPPGPGPFPAVLDLWGIRPGLIEYRASLMASRGIASLALAYVGHKEIPGPLNRLNVGDAYFQAAFQFLRNHPQVCKDRVGILSHCFGVYVSLCLATQTQVNPRCVVGINGVMGSGFLLPADGEAVDPFQHLTQWSEHGQDYVSVMELSHPTNSCYKAQIEKLNCPLLCIVGEGDTFSRVVENADEMEERLRAAGRSHLLTRMSYPGTGHRIDPPYSPNTRNAIFSYHPPKMIKDFGGQTALHAAAQEHSWKRILEFLDHHLRGQK